MLRGDPNGVGAYGGRYSNSNQRISIKANTEAIIPLEETVPAIFIEYDTNYVVSIKATETKLPGSDIKVEGKSKLYI